MASQKLSDYRRLLAYLKPYRLPFFFSILAMIGYGAVDALFVSLIQPLVDDGLSQANSDVLTYAPIAVIVLLFFRGLCNFAAAYGLGWIGSNIVMIMRQQLFAKMLHMPVSFYDSKSTGELISNITFVTEQVSTAASSALVTLVREGAFVLGLLGIMFWHSWQLSAVFLLVGPLVAFAITLVGKRFRYVAGRIQNAMAVISDATEQAVTGHKVVISYGGQEIENERFKAVSNKNRQQMMKLRATTAMSSPIIQVIASLALAMVLFVASFPSVAEALTPGTFASMISAMIMILQPLKKLTNVQAEFQRGIVAARSIFAQMDMKSEKDQGVLQPERVTGKIEFKQVDFTYPSKESKALSEVTFAVEPGKTLALVGRSGSGKSTITQLLTRFYDADHGEIRIDGELISDFSLKCLRRQVAVVSQQVILFNDSIANNIAYGIQDSVTREQIEQAASAAYAMEFIEALPQGLDTHIGQNGINLSGGQRQRIAIARAILRDAPILILDEATSALDTESERYIQKALESLQKNCTSIVVAHRLSTIENADQIAVVDEGKIIEMGTHQELLSQEGAYAQLHKLQFNQ